MDIREADATELGEVGDIRVAAYQAGGFISERSGYAPTLRSLGADGRGKVLVAVDPGAGPACGGPGRIVGTIMLQVWPESGQVVQGPGEAEIRALAVRPDAQGAGVGERLLRAAIERAATLGVTHLVLSTEPSMRAAHRLYERAGFARLPERDWSPVPDANLLVYGLRLG